MRKGRHMAKISVKNFISELDSYFARENLGAAGQCLLEWRERAKGVGDKSGELTVLNEMIGFYRQTKDEKSGMAAINDAFAIIDELGIGGEISAATVYLNGATTMKSFGKSAEAMEFYDRTFEVYKNKMPENSPLFAGLYNNMALALQDIKDYGRAEEYFRKAIEITENLKGSELETAVSCVNLAHLIYETDNESEEINSLMEKSLAILENPAYFGYDKYAFTCRKCATSFGFFGFFFAEKYLNERADTVYAGS